MSRFEFDFCVAADHPCLPGHFPGHPIVPGVLLLDHVLRAVHSSTGRELTHLQHVKFTSALRPDEQAHVWCEVDAARALFRVTAQRLGVVIALAEGAGNLSPQRGAGSP